MPKGSYEKETKEFNMSKPRTLGELKESGWKSRSVRDEMRQNLIALIEKGDKFVEGIVGYDDTVLPQIEHAVLSRHDFLLLGQRGQAKTRLIRQLVNLLDEWMPIVEGCPLNDDPYHPLSKKARHLVADKGDETPIAWVHRKDRYQEKLATPDVNIADLIGDVDPIKAVNEKLEFGDEEVINYGIIPRSNRGIFAINELPDLQPRIQVGLLNIMEEKDVQIRGFPVRIPLDLCIVYTANPEDYTNRGNIITPLKDRIDAQIITHYPDNIEDAVSITKQEAWSDREGDIEVYVPPIVEELIERVAEAARRSEYADSNSGVSARMSISLLETLHSTAERRALINGDDYAVIRVVDIYEGLPAISGKVELVYKGEQEGITKVAIYLIGQAIKDSFNRRFMPNYRPGREQKYDFTELQPVTDWFEQETTVDVTTMMRSSEYIDALKSIDSLGDITNEKMGSEIPQHSNSDILREVNAVYREFVLDGLHQNFLLSKMRVGRATKYSDAISSMMNDLN
jgi:magnesium chelatase subunit I